MKNKDNFKARVQSGESVHGTWINLGSVASAEIVGNAGFDWVLIDLEHGVGTADIMYQQLQALESTDAFPLVRIDELSRPKAQRILDAGASGIMFPGIRYPPEAIMAVSTMYYPPIGIRGMAKMVRSSGFGKSVENYNEAQKLLVCLIQIETLSALKEIEAIADVEGVDVLFVGPSDLSMALGIFNQFDHPLYREAIKSVAGAAKKYGKAAGVLLQDINEYELYYGLGFSVLACGGDAAFVAKGARSMLKQLKG